MTLDAFLALKEDAGIDEKIAAKEKELEGVRQADHIKARAALSTLTLPALPIGFQELLAKSVEGIAQDAEHRVANQIQAHAMHARGEAWLSEGLGYVNNNTCPFCGQALTPAAALLATYKAYFSAAYNELRTSIGTMRSTIETALGDKQIAQFEKTLDQNLAGLEFWSKFCDITAPALQNGAGDKLRSLRQAALALLDRKAAAPLGHIAPDAAFTGAATAAADVAQELATYNQAVMAANGVIAAKKTATGAADIKTVETALVALRLTKRRHEPDVNKACDEYRKAQAQKTKIEEEKASVKKKLDDYTEKVIGKYEQTINRFLDDFNAGFRITETKHAYGCRALPRVALFAC